ncbi:PP2C family protein-serine/threonine phosphatase [Stackebrandtia soli]|uniref:PP2C family protein-serine/threonine phosphatase n=1 Tax=Stackebrandtia soli TaxID=1892856 RepID=UPI0039E9F121
MTLTLRYAAISDRGLIRSGNQDSVYAGPRLIAVADGMGGMAAGDLASSIVIDTLAVLDEDVPPDDLTGALASAVEQANARIRATVEENPQMEGMGTTLTGFLFSGSALGMVHIGDSRAYRLRDGVFTQVTKDDTYVQMLVDEGQLTPEEAETHPQRSLLLRALGSNEVEPTFATLEPRPRDRYLVCSDGLSGVVSEETMTEVLRTVLDPHEAAERLVQLALRGGGPDNVTVLVADVTDADIIEAEPIIGGAAAADRDAASSADPSTAAARGAAATAAPKPAAPVAEEAEVEEKSTKPKRGKRVGLYSLGVLLLVGILAAGGFLIYQGQYYVGISEGGKVAVFQGVQGDIFGISMSNVEVVSDRSVDDLTQDARNKLKGGIPADDRADALRILADVTDDDPANANLLPLCPNAEQADPSSTPSESPSESASPEPEESTTPSDEPSTSPTQTSSDDPTPGVDCRLAD